MTAAFQLSSIVFGFSMGSYKFLSFLAPPQRAPTVIFKFQKMYSLFQMLS